MALRKDLTLDEVANILGIYGDECADRLAKEATKLSDLIPMSIPNSYHKKVFKEKIISEWNNLHQISNNEHLTKEFIPSIQSRLKAKHFHPNFKLTQFLTGHGNFKAYLKRFNLSPIDQCSCSSDTIQNAKHLILACTKFSSERQKKGKISENGNGIEEVVNIAMQINLEVDCDEVQELLDSHNHELSIDELIEMHEQDIENLKSLERVQ
ncbi:RNase H domain-containing protein [Trichonephila clavipes]|nr:RNase H domain-containing protein [Trichonephila clavipes]